MKQRLLLILTSLLLFLTTRPQSCPLGISGTFSVGPTGDYSTLQAAFDALHQKGLSASVILELQTNYNSAVETFPIRAWSIPCASASKEVTVRPKAGGITITSNDTTATIDLNAATHIIFDGRAGLTINNTHVKGSAIRFVNGASYNRLFYLDLHGVSTTYGTGVVTIGNIDSVNGNNYNRIDSCNISGGATDPLMGIAAAPAFQPNNTGNSITGCNIFDFWGWPDVSCGVYLPAGTDSTTVQGNSFYQTKSRDYAFSTYSRHYRVTAIYANSPSGYFNISGNYIGGTAPRNGGGVMTLSGCQEFTGIYVSNGSGAARAAKVTGNVIANLALKDVTGIYKIINLVQFNGVCSNNTIGCLGGFNTLNAETTENNINFFAINLSTRPTDSSIVTNNHLSGIRVTSKQTGWTGGIMISMDYSDVYNTRVEGNVIGDSESGAFNVLGQGEFDGIYANTSNPTYVNKPDRILIRNNSISGTGSTGLRVIGIYTTGNVIGSIQISGNNIHRLNSGDGAFVTPMNVNVRGIDIFLNDASPMTGTLSCTDNKIYDLLANSNKNTIDAMTGIYLAINKSNKHPYLNLTLSRNLIKQAFLSGVPTDYDGDGVVGLLVDMGNDSVTVDNNVVQLGYTEGTTPPPCPYVGIQQRSGISKYLHNTVLLQGAIGFTDTRSPQIYGSCFQRLDTAGCILMNNLFSVTRSYPGDNNIRFGVLSLNGNQGLNADYNLYYRKKYTMTVLNSGPRADSLIIWQGQSGQDQHSLEKDPLLTDPDKDLQTPPLGVHLDPHSPADAAGTAAFTTLTDIDGELRAGLTPVDIGADAINANSSNPPPPPPPPVDTTTTTSIHIPNPFTTTLTILIKAEVAGTATISIYTFSGRLLIQLNPQVAKGDNTLSIPMANEPDGTYILKIEVDGKKQSTVVMKKT
ncbi:MAG: T9SS type A sorting domain-containing protein [Bacteroidetes bacterium]|nr:T9SS type A sorting domain-containing protein [Bacteroidota bacterium]